VSLVEADPHRPAIYSGFLGSAQRLADRDQLVGWGNVPEVTEFAPGGHSLRMDLSLSEASYRAFRFAWVGRPATPPAVAGRLEGAGTRVWASWNGATQVAAWQALGGAAANHLTPVGSPKAKHGFETTLNLRRRYSYVAARALSSAGKVLGTSWPAHTAG
jgi:hypothetical protein